MVDASRESRSACLQKNARAHRTKRASVTKKRDVIARRRPVHYTKRAGIATITIKPVSQSVSHSSLHIYIFFFSVLRRKISNPQYINILFQRHEKKIHMEQLLAYFNGRSCVFSGEFMARGVYEVVCVRMNYLSVELCEPPPVLTPSRLHSPQVNSLVVATNSKKFSNSNTPTGP